MKSSTVAPQFDLALRRCSEGRFPQRTEYRALAGQVGDVSELRRLGGVVGCNHGQQRRELQRDREMRESSCEATASK
jgi:hypothetical protein